VSGGPQLRWSVKPWTAIAATRTELDLGELDWSESEASVIVNVMKDQRDPEGSVKATLRETATLRNRSPLSTGSFLSL
jgi:hypothetical protein